MAERGQRNTLTIGPVSAEIALLKTSAKPREAQHETRRVDAPEAAAGPVLAADEPPAVPAAVSLEVGGERVDPLAPEPEAPAPTGGFAPLADEEPVREQVDPIIDDLPAIERGVHGPGDVWVNLTDELAAIDERTKLTSMEIEVCVARNAVPSERVRDAHFVAPAGEGAPKVLALLWMALRRTNRAALVRWTKKTNQALGALVARGSQHDPHLVLLELEWQANMRDVPLRAHLLPAMAAVREPEVAAAKDLIVAWQESPSAFERLRDERSGQRADLLDAAREGRPLPVVEAMPAHDDEAATSLAAALAE